MNYPESYTRYLQQDRKIFTDSRNVISGGIFLALKGPHFNGNQFAISTLDQGAAYAIVDEDLPFHPGLIRVGNCLQELQSMAKLNRKLSKARIIAITGSNGKTTTKELCFSVFSRAFETLATIGNLNNHIGVPLTLLRITEHTELAIVEMGANRPADIDELCKIANPDVGLITSIGKAHLEGFGSYEAILKTKSELFQYLDSRNGTSFYNLNDDAIRNIYTKENQHISFGDEQWQAMIKGQLIQELPEIVMEFQGKQIHSKLMGRYNYFNILSACALASWFGIESNKIKEGIEAYIPSNMRSEWILINGCKVLLDAYNANPSSMHSSLETFSNMNLSTKWVVLGEMAELGDYSEEEHRQLIHFACSKNFDKVIFVGAAYQNVQENEQLKYFVTKEDCKQWLQEHWPESGSILIKGSRSSQLEKLIR